MDWSKNCHCVHQSCLRVFLLCVYNEGSSFPTPPGRHLRVCTWARRGALAQGLRSETLIPATWDMQCNFWISRPFMIKFPFSLDEGRRGQGAGMCGALPERELLNCCQGIAVTDHRNCRWMRQSRRRRPGPGPINIMSEENKVRNIYQQRRE